MPEICHQIVNYEGRLLDWLKSEIGLDATFLLQIGAVYVNRKRAVSDQNLKFGDYVRIHTKPRRFSSATRPRILYDMGEFCVVDKPCGLPIHPTLDNAVENVLSVLKAETKHNLYITQRLDVPTRGLVVFAKTLEFQKQFNSLLTRREVDKHYFALVKNPEKLSMGLKVHFMERSLRSSKKVYESESPGLLRCELAIESIDHLGPFGWVKIRLLTGRTHQIRAQMAALGSPLVGDGAYGDEEGELLPNSIGLCCQQIQFKYEGQNFDFHLPVEEVLDFFSGIAREAMVKIARVPTMMAKDAPIGKE